MLDKSLHSLCSFVFIMLCEVLFSDIVALF